jgi:hypothetical protein
MKTTQNRSRESDKRQGAVDGTAAFTDNRSVAAAQRKLASVLQQSKHVRAHSALSEQINQSPVMTARRSRLTGIVSSAARPAAFATAPMQWKRPAAGDSQWQLKADAPRPNLTGLPDHLKAGIENLSGVSMDDVKVHYNSAQPVQVHAHAFAQGTQIHVGPGQERHVAHEAWHVVQQKQGRVQATVRANGVSINDDPHLEREADVQGAKALAHGAGSVQLRSVDGSGHALPRTALSAVGGRSVVQRDAFWAWPLTSSIPTATENRNVADYRQRAGDTNNRLYATAGGARNAAKEVLNLSSEEIQYAFQATKAGVGPAAGTYTYYPDIRNNKTKVLVNHNADPNASLRSKAGLVKSPANHFHAGIIADKAVTRLTENPTDIVYVKHPNAAEHYFTW